jgi:hypothetical protein
MLYFQKDGVEITVYQSTFSNAALVRAIARICVPLEQENRVTVTVVSATRSILLVRLNPRDSHKYLCHPEPHQNHSILITVQP